MMSQRTDQHSPSILLVSLDQNTSDNYLVGIITLFNFFRRKEIAAELLSFTAHGEIPSLGMGSAKHITINDQIANTPQVQEVVEQIKQKIHPETRMIGFSVLTHNFYLSLMVCYLLKIDYPHILLGFGGPLFLNDFMFENDIDLMDYDFLDFYVRGKGEEALYAIHHNHYTLTDKLKRVDGLSFQKDKKWHISTNKSMMTTFSPVSYMNKENMNHALGKKEAYLTTSIGCPYRCTFCTQHSYYPKYISSSAQECVNELKNFKGYHINLVNALINTNHKWLNEFLDKLIEAKIDISWESWFRFNSRMNDYELLRKLYRSGCLDIGFGLESASPTVLKDMKKYNNMEQVYDFFNKLKVLRSEGIVFSISLNILVGYYSETESDFMQTYKFILINSDMITKISSLNPVGMAVELDYTQKLINEGKIVYKNSSNWASQHSTPAIRIERLLKLEKLLKKTNIEYQLNFIEDLQSIPPKELAHFPA